ERLEAFIDGGDDGFVGFAFLDVLVDAFLDEDAFERAEMEFVFEFLLLQLEFALEQLDQLRGVFAQDFADSHLDRPIVLDDDDAAGDGDFAIGERVERVHEFFGIHAGWAFDFNFHFLGSEVVDGFDLELAFGGGVFDGGNERIRGGGGRDFLDDDGGLVLDLDFGADFDAAFAVLVIAGIHQAASRKVRQALERFLFENRDLGLKQFGKIVRQDARGQTDGDAFRAEHERERQFAGQGDRFLVASVVAGDELG